MRTILKDIGQEILKNTVIAALVVDRVFNRPPKNEKSGPYIVFMRAGPGRIRNDVRNRDSFRFAVYSSKSADLENIAEALIEQFDGKTTIGDDNNQYFTIQFVQQSDDPTPLKDTQMLITMLDFDFYKTS